MAKAVRLPSGNWNCTVYAGMKDGKRIRKSFTAKTRKEAEYLASSWLYDKKISLNGTSVEQALKQYIEVRNNILSPATYREYKREAKQICELAGHIQLPTLDARILQHIVNTLSLRLAPHTVKNLYHLLCASIVEAGYEVPSGINLPPKRKIEVEIPNSAEIDLLLKSAENQETKVALMMACYLGMRRGEICAVRWEDFDGERITVCRDMVQDEDKNWIVKSPKTYAGYRTISVPDALISELRKLERKTDFIISCNPNALYNRYRRLLKKCGIRDYRFHALRHYHASLMLSLGIPNRYAAERMGHATDTMLKSVYQHIMAQKKDEYADLIDKAISGNSK